MKHPAWPRNATDRFVLARLEAEGLTPSPEAKKERLIRRVTLDLTGLPPALAEIDAFLADCRPDAYERLVDRLLASPRFGERMAVDWLDVARYADTHGYQADVYRATWPWRDWVVKAFNANLSFDTFITWQLAGDLLPNPTREEVLATAFNRHHRQTNEGGSIEEEWRTEYVADRTITFGAAFLEAQRREQRHPSHGQFRPVRTVLDRPLDQDPGFEGRAVILHRSRAWTDAGSRGYEILIEDGKLSAHLVHFWPGNAIGIKTKAAIPLDR